MIRGLLCDDDVREYVVAGVNLAVLLTSGTEWTAFLPSIVHHLPLRTTYLSVVGHTLSTVAVLFTVRAFTPRWDQVRMLKENFVVGHLTMLNSIIRDSIPGTYDECTPGYCLDF